jgi:phytoene dehydrogenase-like protein
MTGAFDAAVIGAGPNGLVSAAHLAKAGLRVAVLERGESLGGAAATFEMHPGFQADVGAAGPVAIAALERDLSAALAGVEILHPDPPLVALGRAGEMLPLFADPGRAAEAIARFSKRDSARWPEFCRRVSRFARFLRSAYEVPAPSLPARRPAEWLGLLPLGLRWLGLGGKDRVELLRALPMSIDEYLAESFESELLRAALASQGVAGMSLGPMASGTTFRFLHRLVDAPPGAAAPHAVVRGGAGRLWQALAEYVLQRGGVVRTSADVVQVIVREGRTAGLALASGEEIAARAVLSGVDPRRTFLDLVDSGELDPDFVRAVRAIRFRGALARVFFALEAAPRLRAAGGGANLMQGGLTFAPDIEYLERAADDAKYGRVSRAPWWQATLPTSVDPGRAPQGMHVLEVAVQYAPYRLAEGEWDEARAEALADQVQTQLGEAVEGMDRTVGRRVLGPRDLESQFGLSEGNPDQGEMTLDQILFLRPIPGWAHSATPVPGLYLCGAAAHPGGGLHGRPGRLAARRVIRDLRNARSRS